MKRTFYNSQEVAQILGISKQTLYRYEKKKIFPKAKRNPINNRREYAVDDIGRLKKILGRS
ncbi:MAG: MerR family DNA-binding transcriptional regulator [Candidatus Omnitrophica bacterium]|nr:MerR family DNA-binding transcriptional regulator [Candidatus Omnitrophota bacterium]